jgi:hypothetical protein
MNDWKCRLKADPTDWLLGEDNPSVRYFALVDLLDKPESDPTVIKAKAEIMRSGPAPQILVKQESGGYWGTPQDFYIRAKYRGTVWQLIVLAELGIDGNDERVRMAGEFILKNSQDHQSGGFSIRGTPKNGGNHSAVIPCLTGNMVWSLLKFGYFDDPQVQRGIGWITKYQRFDDGIAEPPEGWPYEKLEKCWGRHTCHMGVVKALKALAEIPANKRTESVKATIMQAAEYLLKHHIFKRSHELSKVSIRG